MNGKTGPRDDARWGERDRGRPAGAAFTIVELLVVMSIIAILVGLLIPAVGAVRRVAREASSKAVLTALETGMATYQTESKLGGSIPPSRTDWVDEDGPAARSPYSQAVITLHGAGLLVWSLSGADQLGTPVFRALGSLGSNDTWAESAGSTSQGGPASLTDPPDLHWLNPQKEFEPHHTRYGPYVDTSKVQVTRNMGDSTDVDFAVPAEEEVRDALGESKVYRQYPMYLDGFGYPVLYYRADPAGRVMADYRWDSDPRGIYHDYENRGLLSRVGVNRPLRLNKAGERHAMEWNDGTYSPQDPPPLGSFKRYIMNAGTQAKLWPQRADSYLLITPGYDGLYGTADDITNFDHQGQ